MARTVGIGIQRFDVIRERNCFYVDKTDFIREWWESEDEVTLITRPRRFGKTLTMSMVEKFFSVNYVGRSDLFEGLSIWEKEKYRALQGTYPVISLSFANIKELNYQTTRSKICQLLTDLYSSYVFLLDSDALTEQDKEYFRSVKMDMDDSVATFAIYHLTKYLNLYYGKKVIILLDEYDTPMQEAYVDGYWKELVAFTRSMFNSTFKTNPWLERAIMTGITAFANSEAVFYCECELAGSQGERAISTRVSKESIFSDLNNLKVVTTTSSEYGTAFGFTEEEVFASMDEYGLTEKQKVKQWYDGFIFGKWKDIYNPWSILNFLDTGRFTTYWANTSSNSLVGKLIREGSKDVKQSFERLLRGEHLFTTIDEQIVYNQLDDNEQAIWSLLLASGYLKALNYEEYDSDTVLTEPRYELALTNLEVSIMFKNMVRGWFKGNISDYNDFVKALLLGDLDAMNEYMNRVTCETFSYFDTGKRVSKKAEPERFYHGFVLGLIVELEAKYTITSNRESGFGRYDIMLEPKSTEEDAIVIEFKVFNPRRDATLEDTVSAALKQIEEKKYVTSLMAKGISKGNIRCYGFAFEGKEVLIGE